MDGRRVDSLPAGWSFDANAERYVNGDKTKYVYPRGKCYDNVTCCGAQWHDLTLALVVHHDKRGNHFKVALEESSTDRVGDL